MKVPRKKLPRVRASLIPHAASEPTLGIDAKGRIFTTAAGFELSSGVPTAISVYRSSDAGRSWKEVSPAIGSERRHRVSLDPYTWVDPKTSRVFTIDLTVACSYLSFSDDAGSEWTTNPLACGTPVNDHQTLFGGDAVSSETIGYEGSLLYYCYNFLAGTNCTKSLDGGLTWIPTGGALLDCAGLNGHGVVAGDGTVYLPHGANCGRPRLGISEDEGASWNSIRVADLPSTSQDPSVAVDRKGNVYYVFVHGQKRLPFLTISRDRGETWSKPIMMAAPGIVEVNLATIDVARPGRVAVAYYGTRDEPARSRRYDGVSWNGYLTTTAEALARKPILFSAQINETSDPLKRGRCGPGRCGGVFDFIDVEIAPNGSAWGAFVDACTESCATGGSEGDELVSNREVLGHVFAPD